MSNRVTSKEYQRLEILLSQAEMVTLEHATLSLQEKQIQYELSRLLAVIAAEKYRAERREKVEPSG